MNTTQIRILYTGLFFLFIFISGFWLSRSGKPYNVLFFTIHKLIALAALVFLILTVYRFHQAAPLGSLQLMAAAVTLLFFIGTIIAGGLLSIDKPIPAVVSTMHKFFPYLILLSTSGTLYLLLNHR